MFSLLLLMSLHQAARVAAGEAGVRRALTLLREEVHRDMALLGVRSIAEISSDLVRRL